MKKLLSLLLILTLSMSLGLGVMTASASSETVTFDYAGSCDWLVEVKNPETVPATTSTKTFVISAVAVEGASITLYNLNPETNLYEKMYNADGVAIESVVGASGLYAQQITLKEGINNILVHATNGFDDEAIRLEINFLGESFLEKIKTFTVELTSGLANIIG